MAKNWLLKSEQALLRKHSINIKGHRTSYSLEDAFYEELVKIAKQRNISLARLVTGIDTNRDEETNLSSALRLFVLDAVRGA